MTKDLNAPKANKLFVPLQIERETFGKVMFRDPRQFAQRLMDLFRPRANPPLAIDR